MGRKPKAPNLPIKVDFFSVGPEALGPEALNREAVTTSQVDSNEKTIIWGVGDSLPIRILDAVNKSPTAISCLGKVENFMRGSKFSDEGLMTMAVDQEGTTLWQLHVQFCQYMSLLEAFTARFTFDRGKRITNTYSLGVENLRFVASEGDKNTKISQIKHNPYFGTGDYQMDKTVCYWAWDPVALKDQLQEGDAFLGQVYFQGSVRPPYKHYPVPKYWSAHNAIYVDCGVDEFHKANIDNGFFQSVLMQLIGDPNQLSKNPAYMCAVKGDDGVERMENVNKVTLGQEFSEMMSKRFSGAKKAGTVMALWALTKELAANLQAFPTNTNFDILEVTANQAIRKIATATQTQSILANLPQATNPLGSGGDAMRWAVELMQSSVSGAQNTLEGFYNTIMLPNLQKRTSAKVKIVNYQPVSIQVTVEDKIWEWMNETERVDFVKANYPSIKVDDARSVVAPVPQVDPATGEQLPEAPKPNEALRDLTLGELRKVLGIVKRFNVGTLTFDQAKALLLPYGITEDEIPNWLITTDV